MKPAPGCQSGWLTHRVLGAAGTGLPGITLDGPGPELMGPGRPAPGARAGTARTGVVPGLQRKGTMTTLAARDEASKPAPLVPEAGAAAVRDLPQRALVLRRFGGPEGFELVDQPMPVPGAGEVRVRVLAASVQFTDTLLRRGLYPDLRERPPLILGYDVVGEVVALGPGVTSLQVGDRVADLTMTGSYARFRTLRADRVVPVPPGVDAAEAVAMVLTWATAYQLLHREARVSAGQRVLIHGAAGAVGQALVALGRRAGLQLWGTAHARDAERVRSAGATPIEPRTQEALALVPKGFDVVFDGIGERGFAPSWAAVTPGGTLVGYGFSAAAAKGTSRLTVGLWLLRLHLWDWLPDQKSARFYSITAQRERQPGWYRADLAALFALLQARQVRPVIARRIGLEAVAEAHRQLEAGGVSGKIVLCPWG